MTEIQMFQGYEVRFVGTPEVPEWVATDVVIILYPNADKRNRRNYLTNIPSEWKGLTKVMTPGGMQSMVTLFEPGLYHLIARSKSPLAVPFQKWVFEEVLPSIRKSGSYSVSQSSPVEEKRASLEVVKLGMDLFSQLGGADERTLVRDIVLADRRGGIALPDNERREWPISDRLLYLGYGRRSLDVLKSIGTIASDLYFAYYGHRPPKREQYVDGATRMVAFYSENDLFIVDAAIRQKLGDPPTPRITT